MNIPKKEPKSENNEKEIVDMGKSIGDVKYGEESG